MDWSRLLQERPDVLTEFQQEMSRDAKSKAYLQQIGATTPEGYAQWWYNNYGQKEGYNQAPLAPPTPTSPVAPPVVAPPVQNSLDQGSNDLMNMVSQLLGNFNQQAQSAEQASAAREAARNQVYSTFKPGTNPFGGDFLKSTIESVLSGQYGSTKEQLERAKARGQVNETGYMAGLGKLDQAKQGAYSKLSTTANDILSGYRTKYDALRDEALGYTNTLGAGGTFDLSPYLSRAEELKNEAASAAPGALMNALGDSPLFNFANIRGAAGQAQGALNLRNLDVIDALSKRKRADAVGRGLGSQGAF